MKKSEKLFHTVLLLPLFLLLGSCEPDKPAPIPVNQSKVESITIEPNEVKLNVEETIQLKAIMLPEEATNKNDLVWEVQNPAIATVSNSGLLKATSKGETAIICRVGDVEAKAKLVVEEVAQPYTVTAEMKSNSDLKVTFQITAKNKDAYYNCGIITESNFNNDFIKGLDGLAQREKEWWEFVTGSKNPADWKKLWYKGDMLFNSTSEERGSGTPVMYWDTNYFFYAYEVDEKTGDPVSSIFLYDFATPPTRSSDQTFEVKINSASKTRGIDGYIAPSKNDEEYFFVFSPIGYGTLGIRKDAKVSTTIRIRISFMTW